MIRRFDFDVSSVLFIISVNLYQDAGTLGTFSVINIFNISLIRLLLHLCFFFIINSIIEISYNKNMYIIIRFKIYSLTNSSYSRTGVVDVSIFMNLLANSVCSSVKVSSISSSSISSSN